MSDLNRDLDACLATARKRTARITSPTPEQARALAHAEALRQHVEAPPKRSVIARILGGIVGIV